MRLCLRAALYCIRHHDICYSQGPLPLLCVLQSIVVRERFDDLDRFLCECEVAFIRRVFHTNVVLQYSNAYGQDLTRCKTLGFTDYHRSVRSSTVLETLRRSFDSGSVQSSVSCIWADYYSSVAENITGCNLHTLLQRALRGKLSLAAFKISLRYFPF